tara:strand:- start:3244 stop:5574 length:2331 start_codon:yes stop_codon:yes gene_type:complete
MNKESEVAIEVDGEELTAPAGSMIIQATDIADIYIPRFCYHKELSIAANCRMCLVEVEGAPKPLPACATPVSEGMKVFTKSEKAINAQQGTMEFLLINHPLDCPICDQGGECELQDLAMGYGSGISQYTEGKRVVRDKNLGPLIKTDMTRCIHCTRCVRFGEEVAGLKELGATGRGENMEIGTYIEKTVVSELSGNVIDVCPVGALTNKPYRYSARTWEMREAKSIAPHDMLGSHVSLHAKGQKIKRVVPRENTEINRVWLSDRDRFSYEGINSEKRLLEPKIKKDGRWERIGWEPALKIAAQQLRQVERSDDIIGFGSSSSTVEELTLFQRLIRGLGSHNLEHRLRQIDFRRTSEGPLASNLKELDEILGYDLILIVGADPRSEAPLLNLRIREAALAGTNVIIVDSIGKEANYPVAVQKAVNPSHLPVFLAQLLSDKASADEQQEVIKELLFASKKVLVITGAGVEQHGYRSELLSSLGKIVRQYKTTFLPITEGCNTLGAWLAGVVPHVGEGGVELEPDAKEESVFAKAGKYYFLLGIDPSLDCAVNHGLTEKLKSADFVVALTPFETESLDETADLLLPMALFAENEGTFINGFGRRQEFEAAVKPPGDVRRAWKILRKIGSDMGLEGFHAVSCSDIAKDLPSKIPLKKIEDEEKEILPAENAAKGILEVVVEVPPYSADILVRHADSLQRMPQAGDDYIRISAKTAADLHLRDGDRVGLESDAARAIGQLRIDNRLPFNTCLIAGGRRILLDVARNSSVLRIFSMQGESLP